MRLRVIRLQHHIALLSLLSWSQATKISASFTPRSSGYLALVQSFLDQSRCVPWCQQDAGMKRDH